MLACHAGGPGSIPGRCSLELFMESLAEISHFDQLKIQSQPVACKNIEL